MAYKQIYIKEADVALFEEAERYGDSLSRVISEALKDFVEKKRKELDEEGFGEIELSVGRFPNNIEIKKFRGKKLATCKELLADYQNRSEDELHHLAEEGWVIRESSSFCESTVTWSLFTTKKGKYVIWREAEVQEVDGYEGNVNSHRVNNYLIIDEMPGKDEEYFLKFDSEFEVPAVLFRRAFAASNLIKEEWLDL